MEGRMRGWRWRLKERRRVAYWSHGSPLVEPIPPKFSGWVRNVNILGEEQKP
jgi:hypothetical protein